MNRHFRNLTLVLVLSFVGMIAMAPPLTPANANNRRNIGANPADPGATVTALIPAPISFRDLAALL